MGHVNLCLKCLFIGFNMLFGIAGILFILLCMCASSLASNQGEEIWLFYLIGGAIAAISFLGVFGAIRQMTCALKMFSGLLGIGMVICVIASRLIVNGRSNFTKAIKEELIKEEYKEDLQLVQAEYKLECCGSEDYTDWGPEIPNSCSCKAFHQGTAMCGEVTLYESHYRTVEVYTEPCVPYLMRFMNEGIDIAVQTCFGFALIALIGMIMAFVMIAQINSTNEDIRASPRYTQRSACV